MNVSNTQRPMSHIPEEALHAYLDQALSRSRCVVIESHLAACPQCRGLVRPLGDDEVGDGEEQSEDRPITPGQRVGAGVFGLLVVGISVLSMEGGATIFGVLFGAFGLVMLGVALFVK